MIWMVAWQQTPCGSLPDHDELIAARIGMTLDDFKAKRQWLMRGWWAADDGRLYHDVIILRVQEMMAKRKSEADRKALSRAKNKNLPPPEPEYVPDMSHGTPEGLQQDSTVSPTPVPVPVPEPVITKEQCVGIPAPTHTIPDSFKTEIQKTRPDLDPDIVWGVFVQKTNPRDQTIAVWKSWIARERAPAKVAANPSDPLSDPDTRASIEAKGIAKGLGKWDQTTEQWATYKARVLGIPPANRSSWNQKIASKGIAHAAQ
jgi:hypothetical protein